MYNYFEKFPIIDYLNNPALNILASVKFNELTRKTINIFYPYTVTEGQRPDTIANFYYGDPRYSWVIYLANEIVDPYYEWPLFDKDFKNFINKKYGSMEAALSTPMFYRVNWYGDDSIITPVQYQALPAARKKYWNPTVGYNQNIVSYSRKQIDIAVETNKTIQLTYSNTVPGYILGEKLTQSNGGTEVGSGYIKNIYGNNIVLQYISGTFVSTSGSIVTRSDKTAIVVNTSSSSIINNATVLSTDISETESIYWELINAYDYETELNEDKKHIRLIDKAFIGQIEEELQQVLTPA